MTARPAAKIKDIPADVRSKALNSQALLELEQGNHAKAHALLKEGKKVSEDGEKVAE